MAAVSAYNLVLFPEYRVRWLTMPNILFASQVPLLTAITFYALYRSLKKKRRYLPFVLSLCLFLLGMVGLGISMWPYVVPESVTMWDAAAPERSQAFRLVGTAFIMPIILIYTGWAYWVFRGKVGTEGYH